MQIGISLESAQWADSNAMFIFCFFAFYKNICKRRALQRRCRNLWLSFYCRKAPDIKVKLYTVGISAFFSILYNIFQILCWWRNFWPCLVINYAILAPDIRAETVIFGKRVKKPSFWYPFYLLCGWRSILTMGSRSILLVRAIAEIITKVILSALNVLIKNSKNMFDVTMYLEEDIKWKGKRNTWY